MSAPFSSAVSLSHPSVRHAFFTRDGGVSSGVYASLNGGTGSRDDPQNVRENRNSMAATLGASPEHLLIPYQVHSADALIVTEPWRRESPHCACIVTNRPGIARVVKEPDSG